MSNATAGDEFVLKEVIVQPIVCVAAGGLGLGGIHAVQAEAVEVRAGVGDDDADDLLIVYAAARHAGFLRRAESKGC